MSVPRPLPPTADEVERRFRSAAVLVARPLILGSIRFLGAAWPFEFRATGLEHLQGLSQPVVLAGNHQSHADTPAILETLPRHVAERTAVAAALDVFGSPGNGNGVPSFTREALQLLVAAGFHAFAFDRHGPPLPSLRTAIQLMRNGWNILLYPEGTRSRTGAMAPFKPGVAALARLARRPVVPVRVDGGRTLLPCGATLPRCGRIDVRYGPPLLYRRGETLPAFTARLQACVRAMGGDHGPRLNDRLARDRRRTPLA
jgi:1-acyl-sn-glycerol-3-phosphate acyltransferase